MGLFIQFSTQEKSEPPKGLALLVYEPAGLYGWLRPRCLAKNVKMAAAL